MSRCDVCGNEYDKPMQIVIDGEAHWFDSFECAIHKLAPVCEQCGCRILGHGAEKQGRFYCGAHCAGEADASEMRDRA